MEGMEQHNPGDPLFATAVFMMALSAAPARALPPAQVPLTVPLALMPLPSSLTRGQGEFTVTPSGGAASSFTFNYGQTHDARLEAAVRRAVTNLGRTCG